MLLTGGFSLEAVNECGSSELHLAALTGYDHIVTFLLMEGAQINQQNNRRSTPLHAAVTGNSLSTVQLLLGNGAVVDMEGLAGHRLLASAVGN